MPFLSWTSLWQQQWTQFQSWRMRSPHRWRQRGQKTVFCCLAGTKDIETLMLSCNNTVWYQSIELEQVLDLINDKSCPRRRLYVIFFYLIANYSILWTGGLLLLALGREWSLWAVQQGQKEKQMTISVLAISEFTHEQKSRTDSCLSVAYVLVSNMTDGRKASFKCMLLFLIRFNWKKKFPLCYHNFHEEGKRSIF